VPKEIIGIVLFFFFSFPESQSLSTEEPCFGQASFLLCFFLIPLLLTRSSTSLSVFLGLSLSLSVSISVSLSFPSICPPLGSPSFSNFCSWYDCFFFFRNGEVVYRRRSSESGRRILKSFHLGVYRERCCRSKICYQETFTFFFEHHFLAECWQSTAPSVFMR